MEDNNEHVEVSNSETVTPETFEVLSTNSVADKLEARLVVGQVVSSIEDAYLLYCNYAHAKGFSVKKGDQHYFPGTNELQAKEFECSCEGEKDEKRCNGKIPVYLKPTIRSKCKAKLRITRQQEEEWKVGRFVIEHSHDMVAVDQRHLLRSSRNMSYAQKCTLETFYSAGISVANAVSYMENEVQGAENLSFVRKDAYDHIGCIKKHSKVENVDASALLHHFINKSNKESDFYWNVQLDDENRVMNFFFRDSRCQIDYEYFGDILSVDTTYRTNMYNLICAPFVGINHHRQNVMFGLAFLSDETESSFEWLFKTFLDSMNGKQPESIFTDQCQAMMNAIGTIFPYSTHRLCQWHINQNAPSHLGSLNGDSCFKRLWNKCMTYCDCEEEFEHTWRIMIEEYNISGHKWLSNMYAMRHKWSTTFSKLKFNAGLLATFRSEVTNAVLKSLGNCAISLYDFVLNFEKIQNNWREKEKAEDTRCHLGKAPSMLKNNPPLNSAADVYTLNMYKLFELELINSLNMRFIQMPPDFSVASLEFKVKSHDENSRIRQVLFSNETHEVVCSCHKFESMGILCKHILMIFNFLNVNFIPKQYLKKRWLKNTRYRIFDGLEGNVRGAGSVHESEMVFVNKIMRSTSAITMRCKIHESARKKLTEIIDGMSAEINDFFEKMKLDAPQACDEGIQEENIMLEDMLVRNPCNVRSRGITNKNIQRHWDDKRSKRKGKRRVDNSTARNYKRKGRSSQTSIAMNIQESNFGSQMSYADVAPAQLNLNHCFELDSFRPESVVNQPNNWVNTNLTSTCPVDLLQNRFVIHGSLHGLDDPSRE